MASEYKSSRPGRGSSPARRDAIRSGFSEESDRSGGVRDCSGDPRPPGGNARWEYRRAAAPGRFRAVGRCLSGSSDGPEAGPQPAREFRDDAWAPYTRLGRGSHFPSRHLSLRKSSERDRPTRPSWTALAMRVPMRDLDRTSRTPETMLMAAQHPMTARVSTGTGCGPCTRMRSRRHRMRPPWPAQPSDVAGTFPFASLPAAGKIDQWDHGPARCFNRSPMRSASKARVTRLNPRAAPRRRPPWAGPERRADSSSGISRCTR